MPEQLPLIAEPRPALRVAKRRRPFAIFSGCELHGVDCPERACIGRRYRYLLGWPTGVDNRRVCLWCLANPSKASAESKDPTINRGIIYAREWGYGWSWTINVRAWRATDPDDVPADSSAIGTENAWWIARAVRRADLIVCGWGRLGGKQARRLMDAIRIAGKVPHALKINTSDGSPSHPLYLPSALRPVAMEGTHA